MKIYVYPGADGSFRLYEDEENNYNFEKGAYRVTEFVWDDSRQELSVKASQGSYQVMEELRYSVEIVKSNQA